MAEATARSGGGRTVATFPSGGGARGGGGGGGGGYGGGYGGMIDPGLLRAIMMQGLSQREQGFTEWLKNTRQRRELADVEGDLLAERGKREEDDFYQRNVGGARRIGGGGSIGGSPRLSRGPSAAGGAMSMIRG